MFRLATFIGVCCLTGGSAIIAAPAAPAAPTQPDAKASLDWPKWRGPRGDNIPVVKAFPQDLAKGLTKKWSANNLCVGKTAAAWSCPSILGDKLVVTGRDNAKDTVFCLNAQTGEQIWKQAYDALGGQVQYGDGPRATPTIDGDRVYTFGCMGHLACWSLADGKNVWTKNVSEFGGKMPMWGHSSSPLVHGGLVIVQGGGAALAIALDAETGRNAWVTADALKAGAGYAAPMVATIAGKEQVIILSGDSLFGLTPKTGAKLWEMRWPTAFGMNCCTPQMVGDKLLVTSFQYKSNEKAGLVLLEFGAEGPKPVWTNHVLGAPDNYGVGHNDPAIIDGNMYAFTGFSTGKEGVSCIDLATGKRKWYSAEAGGPGSVIRVGDQLLLLNNAGKLILAKPSADGFEKISDFDAVTAVTGQPVWTEPVIAHGRLYIRFCNQLICYAVGEN